MLNGSEVQIRFLPILSAVVLLCSGTSAEKVIHVSDVAELHMAIRQADLSGGHTTIRLADGTYNLDQTLYINAPGITLAGDSGRRDCRSDLDPLG